jgi:hypothetical protein
MQTCGADAFGLLLTRGGAKVAAVTRGLHRAP